MKKILITVIAIATLIGCKKGENDPAISLRSRDARIIGEWTLSNYSFSSSTSSTSSAGNSTTSVKVEYDGSKYVTTRSPGAAPADATTYETKLDIQKNGKMVYTRIATSGNTSATEVQEGTWSWSDSHKNKSQLFLDVTGDIGGRNYFEGGFYTVDQLKNKEVVLTLSEGGSTTSTGVAGSTFTSSSTTSATLTQ